MIPVPMWWDRQVRIDYIKELASRGLKNYIAIIYGSP
jgi:hypothetical protein